MSRPKGLMLINSEFLSKMIVLRSHTFTGRHSDRSRSADGSSISLPPSVDALSEKRSLNLRPIFFSTASRGCVMRAIDQTCQHDLPHFDDANKVCMSR